MSGDGYMTLLGTEAVSRAASTMSSAADSISRSVGFLDEALARDSARRDEQLARLEALVDRIEKVGQEQKINPFAPNWPL